MNRKGISQLSDNLDHEGWSSSSISIYKNAKQKKQAIVWLVLFYMQKRTGEFLTKAPDKIFFLMR